jgi:hypothetical protein
VLGAEQVEAAAHRLATREVDAGGGKKGERDVAADRP